MCRELQSSWAIICVGSQMHSSASMEYVSLSLELTNSELGDSKSLNRCRSLQRASGLRLRPTRSDTRSARSHASENPKDRRCRTRGARLYFPALGSTVTQVTPVTLTARPKWSTPLRILRVRHRAIPIQVPTNGWPGPWSDQGARTQQMARSGIPHHRWRPPYQEQNGTRHEDTREVCSNQTPCRDGCRHGILRIEHALRRVFRAVAGGVTCSQSDAAHRSGLRSCCQALPPASAGKGAA